MRKFAYAAAAAALLAGTIAPAYASGPCPAPLPVGGGINAAPAVGIMGCAAGVIFAAIIVNAQYGQPLTSPGFCGLGATWKQPAPEVVRAKY